MCLIPPLRDWFPRAAFALRKTVGLKHPKGRSNPTVVVEHDKMDGAALVDDLVDRPRGCVVLVRGWRPGGLCTWLLRSPCVAQ
jgi:hypothetical protein